MSLTLDPKRPIYLQIMEEVKKRAVRGEYKSGHKLPSVREMAKSVGVNPNTIARVYMELEREGFIFTRRGQGSFITEESGRLEEERMKLADDATEHFIRAVQELELQNGHRQKLIEMIERKLT
jgi:GntR family transcriptional regulator